MGSCRGGRNIFFFSKEKMVIIIKLSLSKRWPTTTTTATDGARKSNALQSIGVRRVLSKWDRPSICSRFFISLSLSLSLSLIMAMMAITRDRFPLLSKQKLGSFLYSSSSSFLSFGWNSSREMTRRPCGRQTPLSPVQRPKVLQTTRQRKWYAFVIFPALFYDLLGVLNDSP